jgi:D-glycero-D-manno-heptose 1,7-bisphosphate phosphatase
MSLEPLHLAGPAGPAGPGGPAGRSGPALLCDRDGTVVENRADYIRRAADIAFVPGAIRALRRAADHGCTIVLVTNQSPVGRGLITADQAVGLHRLVLAELHAGGVPVAGSYLCPHAPWHRCACRKPAPGMLTAAVARFALDRARTTMIGDAVADVAAAAAAGMRGVLVRTGRGAEQAAMLDRVSPAVGAAVVPDLSAAVDLVCGESWVPHAAGRLRPPPGEGTCVA